MPEDVFNPRYWSDRLAKAVAREQAHYAVFEGSVEKWNEGRKRQEKLLAQHVGKSTSVLDVGCGWGRLLGVMPREWEGEYVGMDLCPEFVALARRAWDNRSFMVRDVRVPFSPEWPRFDLAVCCSIKPMVVRNAGLEEWQKIESNIRVVADKILLLGYDDLDDEEGVI